MTTRTAGTSSEGDAITAELTAMRLLGRWVGVRGVPRLRRDHLRPGGRQAGPARPGVGLPHARRAAPARWRRWPPSTTPSWSAGCATSSTASVRTLVLEHVDGPAALEPDPQARPAAGAAVPAAGHRGGRRPPLPPAGRGRAPRREAEQHDHGSAGPADRPVGRPVPAARHGSRRIGTDAYMAPEQADPETHGGAGHEPTSGAWARRCSTRSPATGPSRATRTPTPSPNASRSWSRTPGRSPTTSRPPRQGRPGRARAATPAVARCPPSSPTPWSRSSPACRPPAHLQGASLRVPLIPRPPGQHRGPGGEGVAGGARTHPATALEPRVRRAGSS